MYNFNKYKIDFVFISKWLIIYAILFETVYFYDKDKSLKKHKQIEIKNNNNNKWIK